MRGLVRLLGVLLLACACATPIGVVKGDTQSVYRELTSSVLSTGEPSQESQEVLRRHGLSKRFEDEPEAVLAELRASGSGLARDRLFALAELSFAHAERSQKREYYLAAALYAYAFLFEDHDRTLTTDLIDPRTRLAADLYNLGLTLGLKAPGEDRVVVESGRHPLPFGQLELTVDPGEFLWGGYRMSRFVAVAEFKVRGLRNRYRQPGVGAPLAAEVTPEGAGPEAQAARRRIPPRVKVPVTAFVRIENPAEAIVGGQARGRIELYPADEATVVRVGGRELPLELEPTATLAYQLEGAPVWDTELAGFLSAYRPVFPEGLVMMYPYRRGRVPVVLIHGTASSPARWAEMVNELENDPVLRSRIQVWLFTYDTSNPILLSASRLRDSLRSILTDLDPDGRDPALRRMVLIGHSQGGLLARLMVTDSGTRFWNNVSDVPFSQIDVTPETRRLIEKTMFFEPLPFVQSVVFIATPHRGSFRVSSFVLNLVRKLVTLPVTVVKGLEELAETNPNAVSHEKLRKIPTAVDNMRPGQPFLQALSASPMATDVAVHSIVAVQGTGPLSRRTDGVVAYESAHLDVGSEKVVESSHSVQSNPDAIEEVRRILREHVAGN